MRAFLTMLSQTWSLSTLEINSSYIYIHSTEMIFTLMINMTMYLKEVSAKTNDRKYSNDT